jgi:translation initiation factor IF-2
MSEKKSTKVRLYKYAAEINLSSENLIDFLKEKGFKVKSHQSILTEEMMAEVNAHFKKDIEKAEQHYKKIAEFNKMRAEKSDKEGKVEEEVEQAEEVKEIVVTDVKVEELVTEVESAIEIIPEEFEISGKGARETNLNMKDDDHANFVSPKDQEAKKAKGLKVVGKIDLGESKKAKAQNKKEIVQKSEETSDVSKKRKRPKSKKKVGSDAASEEVAVVKKRKRVKKFEIDEKDVKAAIKKTMLSMDDMVVTNRAASRKKKRKEREAEEERLQELKSLDKNKIRVNEFIAVSELANLMNVPVGDVISKCISLGLMVSINQRLDVETITLVADEFGFEVEFQKEYTAEVLEDLHDDEESLQPRSPVVTIMGHVDHGKTSLLDYIRRTNVVAGESGGITQHIGAYRVEIGDGKQITFLDTPGHEAFTAMRARGAQLTDIVVLVVAADDAVMPQTVEALNHAQAAGVPIIIAINKIDKPGANPDKIKQQMADRNLLVEDWGGKYQSVQLSAKTGLNVDLLLEKIILESDLLDLKANPNRYARGAVVEAELDKGRGITGTILVQKGTLKIGDPFIAGIYHGKVRAMFDERGNKVFEAPPSTPVLVLGFEGAPQAGDTFIVLESEREAREISVKRQQLKREQDQKQVHHITLDEIAKQISVGGVKELALIVKGDVDGSVEALSDSLMKLSNQEVVVRVIHKGVGGISESDVLLAAASDAIIIGFHVRPNINARKLAESQKVDIRLYSVIYNAINEVKSALEGLLSPLISEEVTATVEVRDIFKVPKSGTVAGCYVLDGKITRNNKIRLIRDGIVVHEGSIGNLRRFKDDVREVDAGYECGLNIENFNDVKVGDIIESFKIVETKKTLA